MSDSMARAGIVKGVKASYKDDEPVNLVATVRFTTDVPTSERWGNKTVVTDVMDITFPLGSDVNAGDVITMNVTVTAPFGKRFQPALEATVEETVTAEPDDQVDSEVLEVAVDVDWNDHPLSTLTYVSADEDTTRKLRFLELNNEEPTLCDHEEGDDDCLNWTFEAFDTDKIGTQFCRLHGYLIEATIEEEE